MPIAFRGNLTASRARCRSPLDDARRARDHGPGRRDGRAAARRGRGALRVRRADRRHRSSSRSRSSPYRSSSASRVTGVLVISKLGLDQFDADDLRVHGGARRACVRRARERAPVRSAAPGGGEREGSARVRARRRRRPTASQVAERVAAGAARILGPERSVWLPSADGEDHVALGVPEPSDGPARANARPDPGRHVTAG